MECSRGEEERSEGKKKKVIQIRGYDPSYYTYRLVVRSELYDLELQLSLTWIFTRQSDRS